MQMIEPHVTALLCFAGLWTIVSVGFYVLSGAFPFETRPDLAGRFGGKALVLGNLLLLFVLSCGSLAYGVAHLRWSSLIIVVGLGVLFAPGLFSLWPERWRDGKAGLVIVMIGFVVSLGSLAVGGLLDFSL